MTLQQLQKEILENKKRKGFNTTDMNEEFCHLNVEVSEAYEAWYEDRKEFPEELADVAIFLLGIAEINGINLQVELEKRHNIAGKKLQRENIDKMFCSLNEKISKAYSAWFKDMPTFPEEVTNVAVFLFEIAKITNINLLIEIEKKVNINKNRKTQVNNLGHCVHSN